MTSLWMDAEALRLRLRLRDRRRLRRSYACRSLAAWLCLIGSRGEPVSLVISSPKGRAASSIAVAPAKA